MFWHIGIALSIQLAVTRGLRTNWWAGAAAGICWSVSREIAQAEYRWIEQWGRGLRANMPWWGPFDPRVWHGDALLDWALPTMVVIVTAWILEARKQ